MPRRERERELARRRKRSEKRRKLRAKGLLGPPEETTARVEERRKPKRAIAKNIPRADTPPQEERAKERTEELPPQG